MLRTEMTAMNATPTLSFEDRVDARTRTLSEAVASRIRAVKGDRTQAALADELGKSSSSVSRDLSGDANLSLRIVAAYETALDETVVSIPSVERSENRGRRRRRRPDGGWATPDVQADRDVDPVERRLRRLLTRFSRRLLHVLNRRDGMTQAALAEQVGKDPSYVSRVLGGGVNLTLKTIAQFEVALNACLLKVEGLQSKGAFTGRGEKSEYVDPFRATSDGCTLRNSGRPTPDGFQRWLQGQNQECVSDEPEMMAA